MYSFYKYHFLLKFTWKTFHTNKLHQTNKNSQRENRFTIQVTKCFVAICTMIPPYYAYSYPSLISAYIYISDNAWYYILNSVGMNRRFYVQTKTKFINREKLFRLALTTLDFAIISGNTLHIKSRVSGSHI